MNHKMTFAKRTITAFFAIIAAICFCTAIRIAATSADGRVSLLLEGDGTGYFYNENEIVLGENDSAAISFSVKNYLGRYEEKLGFFFASSDGEKEFSVLFDKTGATYRGFSEEEERDAGAVIADLFREGMYLRATLSDYERSFIVEKRVNDTSEWSTVIKKSGAYLGEGTALKAGLVYDGQTKLAVTNFVLEAGADYKGAPTENLSYKNIVSEEGAAYVELDWDGNGFYGTKEPVSVEGGKILVAKLKISDCSLSSGAGIGFAIGSEVKEGRMSGNGSAAYVLNERGLKKYTDGDYGKEEYAESYLSSSVITQGKEIKFSFDPGNGAFRLFMKFFDGGSYSEVYGESGLSFPGGDLYFGLVLEGSGTLQLSEYSFYTPVEADSYFIEEYTDDLVSSGEPSSANGMAKITLKKSSGYDPRGYFYTQHPMSVGDDESVALFIKNIQYLRQTANTRYLRFALTFANSNDRAIDMMVNNVNFSMFYNVMREEWWEKTDEDKENVQVLTDQNKIDTVFAAGNSVMATFTPSSKEYKLYVKTPKEPDYSLLTTFRTNVELDKDNIYFGFGVSGEFYFEAEQFSVYKIKTSSADVLSVETAANGSAEKKAGGITHSAAESDAYIYADNVTLEEGKAFAIEYGLEIFGASSGMYQAGFVMTANADPDAAVKSLNGGKIDVDRLQLASEDTVFYYFKRSAGLTEGESDTIRSYLFATGKRVRLLFTETGFTVQHRGRRSESWADVKTFSHAADFKGINSPMTFAIVLQYSSVMSLFDDVKAYVTDIPRSSEGIVSDEGYVSEAGVYSEISVVSADEKTGKAYITDGEERVSQINVTSGETVTIIAEAAPEYKFRGWYVGGKKVSDDAETDIEAESSAIYEARFAAASEVRIYNGLTTVEDMYFDGEYIGVVPEQKSGFKFIGWKLSVAETVIVNEEEQTETISEFRLLKTEAENDLLKPYRENGLDNPTWKSLVNVISKGGACTVKSEEYKTEIAFGSFSVIDRKEYSDGTLIVKIPSIKSEFEENEEGDIVYTSERYAELEALYERAPLDKSLTEEREYDAAYKENLKKQIIWAASVAAISVMLIAGMVTVKIIIGRKKK